jgi:hypothetical protein
MAALFRWRLQGAGLKNIAKDLLFSKQLIVKVVA